MSDRPTRAELKQLSDSELRQAYVDIVGRKTKSTNRDYLIWKIRQVVKGKIVAGTGKKNPSRGTPKRRSVPKVKPSASQKNPSTTLASFKAVWATIDLIYREQAEREAINLRLRMSGLEVDDSDSSTFYVNSGIPVIDPAGSEPIAERIKRATEYATDVAMGKAQPMPIPSLLKEHKFRHVQSPDGFAPVSNYASAAWFLEASLHEELKKADADTRKIVLLYLKQLSKAEEASIDEKEDALFILLNFWDRGDIGCAEVMRQLSRQPTGISMRVTDVEATKVRLISGQVIDKDTFLYWPKVDSVRDSIDEKMLAVAHKKAEGLIAVTERPWSLEKLDLSDTAKIDDSLQTHVNTDARAVELAVLKQAGGGSPLKLMRLYLRGISNVQQQYGIRGNGEQTLAFVRENWNLGDVGAARKYAEAVLAEHQVLLPKRPNRRRGGPREEDSSTQRDVGPRRIASASSLDERMSELETRLQRRR